MLATERLLEVEQAFGDRVQSIIPLELDGETLRLVLYFEDGKKTGSRRLKPAWKR